MIRHGDQIEFSGRVDRQFKFNGQLVEPAEIEAALIVQPGIQQAAVVFRTFTEESSVKAIIAFLSFWKSTTNLMLRLTLQGGCENFTNPSIVLEIRDQISKKLPPWMIPHHFEVVDTLPVNPHGKIDYHALSAVKLNIKTENQRNELLLPMEALISSIWKDVLGLSSIAYDGKFSSPLPKYFTR